MHYIIGKCKGFIVHGAHDPHFVTKILPETNQIVVGLKEELEEYDVELRDMNMFDESTSFDTTVKLRYRTTAVPCHVEINGDMARIKLKEPVLGVAKGQAAVFYNDNKLIGGGWIA